MALGSAYPSVDEPHAEIRGRDPVSGLPKTIVISAEEIRRAIEEPVALIVDTVKTTLDKCPPELAGDVMDRGIALTGGGALLRGLGDRLREETGMPVHVADNPLDSVVLGTGKCVEDFDTLSQVLVPESQTLTSEGEGWTAAAVAHTRPAREPADTVSPGAPWPAAGRGDLVHDTRRTRIVLGVLLAAALALITINYRGGTGSRVGGLRGLGGSVFGSVESASLVTRPVAAFTDGLTGSSSQGKIDALQRQAVDLRAQLNQQRLSKYDEGQLSQLLQLAGRGRYRVVAASVIAVGASYDDSVTIDAGRVDGIKPDETVLNGQGLVGTVTSASATTSTVLLATDASVTVGVRLPAPGRSGW